jgi:hypothetical protein
VQPVIPRASASACGGSTGVTSYRTYPRAAGVVS